MTKNYKFTTLLTLIVALLIAACANSQLRIKFEGQSMLPAFEHGDRLLIETNFGSVERGDVVAFDYPVDPTKHYIKRVIGLPGETIAIDGGTVLIDGKPIPESYVDSKYSQDFATSPPFKIPDESFYVLGDNRDNAYDSRYFGAVKEEFIVGKVVRKY